MNRSSAVVSTSFACAAFLAIALPPSAANAAEERVVAFADHYAFRNSAHFRLDALERAVRDARPGVLRIDVCGTDAARAFKAAAHRFSDLPLTVTVQNENAATCRSEAIAVPAALHASPLYDIDDAQVERYWLQTMP